MLQYIYQYKDPYNQKQQANFSMQSTNTSPAGESQVYLPAVWCFSVPPELINYCFHPKCILLNKVHTRLLLVWSAVGQLCRFAQSNLFRVEIPFFSPYSQSVCWSYDLECETGREGEKSRKQSERNTVNKKENYKAG